MACCCGLRAPRSAGGTQRCSWLGPSSMTWRTSGVPLDQEDWDRLPDRAGVQPHERAEWSDLVAAIRRAVDEEFTDHQRRVFIAIILNDVPVDALAVELNSNRNAIYKALFDARRKLRANLAANGYISDTSSRAS